MTQRQAAVNAAAVRNLTQRLEAWGLSDPDQRAHHIAGQLEHDGWRPIDKPPLPKGPGAKREAIDAAIAHTRNAVAAARAARIDTETQKADAT